MTAPTTVALLLPGAAQGYTSTIVRGLTAALEDRGHRTQRLAWPPVLTAGLVSSLQRFDWVVTDVADTVAGVTALAFLHGHAIPMLRLHRTADGTASQPEVEKALFGGFEVGYCEDLLSWSGADGLAPGVRRQARSDRRAGAPDQHAGRGRDLFPPRRIAQRAGLPQLRVRGRLVGSTGRGRQDWRAAPQATRLAASGRPQAVRASRVCWPGAGAGSDSRPGVREKRGAGAGWMKPPAVS